MRLPASEARAGALERRLDKQNKSFVIVRRHPARAHAAHAAGISKSLTHSADSTHRRSSIRNPRHHISRYPPVPPALLRVTQHRQVNEEQQAPLIILIQEALWEESS
jgi:hypothetical protein